MFAVSNCSNTREQDVLQIDGQRQQAVEERRDRRQFVPDAVAIRQLEPCRILEAWSEQPSTLPMTSRR